MSRKIAGHQFTHIGVQRRTKRRPPVWSLMLRPTAGGPSQTPRERSRLPRRRPESFSRTTATVNSDTVSANGVRTAPNRTRAIRSSNLAGKHAKGWGEPRTKTTASWVQFWVQPSLEPVNAGRFKSDPGTLTTQQPSGESSINWWEGRSPNLLGEMAPRAGLEPATLRLTEALPAHQVITLRAV
jgi:hypothetical protein